jgi:hypothetical protein
MAKKIKCHCGCESQVSASTERRHRAGKATPRVKASHAARRVLYAPQHLPQTSAKLGPLAGCSSVPGDPSQHEPPSNAQIHPLDDNPMDLDGGNSNTEIEPTSNSTHAPGRTLDTLSTNTDVDDSHVSEVVANIREEARCPRHPVTIEDYSGEDENSSGDDESDYDEMLEDDEMCADGGLGMNDIVDEDFEQELAEFGTNNSLSLQFSTHCVGLFQPRKSPRTKLPSFAILHSRSTAT